MKCPNHIRVVVFACVMLSALVVASPIGALAKTPASIGTEIVNLDRKVPDFTVTKQDLVRVAGYLSAVGIPIGLELERQPPAISLSLRNASVREILNDVVTKAPGFRWVASTGVIHIEPIETKDSSPLRTLNLKVSGFTQNDHGVPTTIALLSVFAAQNGIPIVPSHIGSSVTLHVDADALPEDARVSVSVEQPTTVREVLDRIILQDAPAYWVSFPNRSGKVVIFGGVAHGHKRPARRDRNRPLPPSKPIFMTR